MLSNLRRPSLFLVLALSHALSSSAPAMGSPFANRRTEGTARDTVLYLVEQDPNGRSLVPVRDGAVCKEPNLVVITHGWYEREPWPAQMALAIQRRVGTGTWRCGWYDWRRQARRFFPSDAARLARDTIGPGLARQILQLSTTWRHIHLIGHSAGSWAINEAANTLAAHTSASLHLTFLDAYVPDGWNADALARLASDPNVTCWAEHYFTRDPLNLTENLLTHAHNVDITGVNPGFKGHKFPWHWYQATIAGEFTTREQFVNEKVFETADSVTYGFHRALEAGPANWEQSVALLASTEPVRMTRR